MRINPSTPEDALAFLVAQRYPFEWTVERLHDCEILALFEGSSIAGYVWGEWHPWFAGVIEFHACIAMAHAGRWHHVIPECLRHAASIGASAVICTPIGGNEGRIARLLKRIGFHPTGRSFFRFI